MTTQAMSLLEQLEAATEGSRELDKDLWFFLGGDIQLKDGEGGTYQYLEYIWNGEQVTSWDDYQRETRKPQPGVRELPRFTTSIDAALALVERVLPGWAYNLNSMPEAWLWNDTKVMDRGTRCQGATIPLAICITLVKAEGE